MKIYEILNTYDFMPLVKVRFIREEDAENYAKKENIIDYTIGSHESNETRRFKEKDYIEHVLKNPKFSGYEGDNRRTLCSWNLKIHWMDKKEIEEIIVENSRIE